MMSYQVLARQWRPSTFSEVVGQQHVLQALSNALRHQRLHHAYLLSGTRGVGKTTIARILSRSLNCVTGITPNPCGECEACVQINEGRFVDLLEIDAASRTKVEDTREILENVQYRPTSGRYKVYLIDEVHMLSRHSFNALLKTLEEPPEHAIFLLATTEPDKLPVTVLSRCLQFNLRALTREEIAGQLSKVLSAESIPFEASALELLARAARGSMRDALSLTDQAIAQGDGQVNEQGVAMMLGRLDPRDNIALLNYLAQGQVDQALQHLRSLPDRMTDISDVLNELQNLLHQLALLQIAPNYLDSGLVKHQEGMQALAALLAPEQIQVWYRMVLEGRRELPLATDAFAAVEMTLLRLLTFRPVTASSLQTSAPASHGEPALPEPEPEPEPTLAEPEVAQQQPEQVAEQPVQAAPPTPPRMPAKPTPPPTALDEAELVQQQDAILQQASAQHVPAPSQPEPMVEPPAAAVEQPAATAEKVAEDPLASLLATRDLLAGTDSGATPPTPQASEPIPTTAEPTPRADSPPPKPEPAPEPQVLVPEHVHALQAPRAELTPQVREAADIDGWSASIAGIEPQGLVRQLLLHSNLKQQAGGYVLTIGSNKQTLWSPQTEQHLTNTLQQLIGDAPLTIEFGEVQNTPFMIQQEIDSYRLQLAASYVEQHDDIQALTAALELELVDGSIQPRD
ncbi:DNA polymerase III subunit gamma/tau [Aliidiomarina taiwanensis]|uniref:DNA polymerase III subunit gamma/tau n=2 Tax=Aliidiomarina taiwanensis TaxID=946228 RepID=A0A432X277_9GAMM|nr:DNA polymerase III subunit gamma/tau [Aliidiomarina taiwanensis]